MKHLMFLFNLMLVTLFFYSCKGADGGFAPTAGTITAPSIATLSISPAAVSLAITNIQTFTASGGIAPYRYSVFTGSGSILSTTGSFTAPGLAGFTTVRVIDSLGATSDAIVTTNAALQISPVNQSLGINSTQAYTVSGGVTPYTFLLVSGAGSIDSAGVYTSASSPGTNTVRVRDSYGNTSDANINVFSALGISPTSATIAVNNTTTFTAAGGVGPYVFSILSGTGAVNASSGIYTATSSSGSATVRVTDSLGATADSLVTVQPALALSPLTQTTYINSSITFTASGGVTPYAFTVIAGSGTIDGTTGIYTAPAANGVDSVRVTDSYGNFVDAVVTTTTPIVISPAAITLAVNNTTTFSVAGGTGPFTYSKLSGTGSVNSSTGLYTAPAAAGSASIRVTDSLGAFDDALVTVNPALAISPLAQVTLINSSVNYSGTGGVAPYTFAILSGTGSIVSGTGVYTAPAANGSASVQVTDSLGNTASTNVTVTTTMTLTPSAVSLAVNNTQSFSVSGGTGPFSFALVSGIGSINSATGVYTAPAGTGSAVVRVTDSLGATDTANITVNAALAISPTSQTTLINSVISFSATGGVAPYTFAVASGTGTINSATGSYTAPPANGNATVQVTDSYGNTATATIIITSVMSLSPTAVTLAVNNTQSFTVSGGTGPYTFSLVSGTGGINSSTGLYAAPAASGSAVVRVTDNLGATDTANITINAALAISPVTQTMGINGTLNFSSTGGVVPYAYSIFSGSGSVNASSGLFTAPASPGTTVVRVTDSYGNTSNSTVTVTSGLSISPASVTLAVGNGITFVGANGATPYVYSIVSGGGSINASTGAYVAPAGAGTATVRVTDSLSVTADATVTINPALAISPATKTLAVNNSFTFSATGGVSPYSFSIVAGTGSINASSGLYTAPVSTGSATVRVTDGRGNVSNSTVTITAALAISPTTQVLLNSASQTFTGSGGVSPYTYSIFTGGGSINSSSGAYTAPATNGSATVRVTDSFGDTADAAVTITSVMSISPATKTLAVNNVTTFTVSGGTGPYTYSVLSGSGSIVSATGVYTAPAVAGSATVRVTDSLGATSNSTVTINAALAISPTAPTLLINASQTFTGSGGVSPYTFTLQTGTGSVVAATGVYTAPASNGTATVRVTDTLGNTADANIIVTTTMNISPSSVTLAVNNSTSFTVSGGTGPFSYSVFSGTGTIVAGSGVYTAPSGAGTATVRVTDSLGATSNAAVNINAALTLSPASATIASTGTQAYSVTGGVSPFTYSIVSGPGSINSSTGLYTGATAGSVVVMATDSLGNTSTGALTVNGPLSVTPVTAYVVINSDLALTAVGGVSPYSYAVVVGGGVIDIATGVYTAAATTGSATLRTTDSSTPTASTFDTTVTIYNALTLTPLSLTIAASGTQTFVASGGVGARTFSMYSGTGTINSSTGAYVAGVVAGTDLIHVTDTIGNVVESRVTVVSQLSITPSSLKLPVFSTMTFTSVLGSSPYVYSVTAGTGSINSATGLYTAPSTAGTGTARVTDAVSNFSDAAITHIEPVEIASGSNHSCIRYSDGSVKCFGLGSSGQLGNGSTTNIADTAASLGGNIPFVNLGTGRTATMLAVGFTHSCARLDNATVKCWGQNTYGELGIGNTTNMGSAANQMGDSLPAVNVGTGRTVTKIYAFGYSTCAILDNGAGKCWGLNTTGQLGLNDVVNRGTAASQMGDSLPTIYLGSGITPTKFGGGLDFTCALLSNATVKCFGGNRYGQLGQGSTIQLGDSAGEMTTLPAISLGTGRTAVDIGVGYSHACAILDNAAVKCWGRNNKGQLAVESTATTIGASAGQMGDSLIACPFSGFTPTKIIGGNTMTCFANASGAMRCFGLNTSGQLLLGSTTTLGRSNNDVSTSANINMGTGLTASSFGVGFYSACVITSNKRVKCWGSSLSGATGNGQTANNLGDVVGELGDSLPYMNH